MDISYRHRIKKRKKIISRTFIVAILAIVFVVLLWGLLWIPYFRVQNVIVGQSPTDAVILKEVSLLLAKKHTFPWPGANYFILKENPNFSKCLFTPKSLLISPVKIKT